MNYKKYYSIKNLIPYAIGSALTIGIIIGPKFLKRNLEERTEEASRLASEMVQRGVGS